MGNHGGRRRGCGRFGSRAAWGRLAAKPGDKLILEVVVKVGFWRAGSFNDDAEFVGKPRFSSYRNLRVLN